MNGGYIGEKGELLIKEGRVKEGQELLDTARDYILRMNPHDRDDFVAICCHVTTFRDGKPVRIHCGKRDDEPLFPGSEEERKKLCFQCQKWCLERVSELKKAFQSRKIPRDFSLEAH